MSLDTISLSDIGKSLCQIEEEIKSNESNILYYQKCQLEMEEKNKRLKQLALEILRQANPILWKGN